MSAVIFAFCQKLQSSRIDFTCNKINLYCLKCTFDIILNHINANSLYWINGLFNCSTKVCNLLFIYNQCKHHRKSSSSWLYLHYTNVLIINGNSWCLCSKVAQEILHPYSWTLPKQYLHSRDFSQELFDGILVARNKTILQGKTKTRKRGEHFLGLCPCTNLFVQM